MTKGFRWVWAWWLVGSLAFLLTLHLAPQLAPGEWVPADGESFYHARRMLDLALAPHEFYQFDTKVYAPEGDWLVWPWAYDYVVGWGLRMWHAWDPEGSIVQALAYFPSLWIYINCALVLAIVSALGLSYLSLLLAGLCFAILPVTLLVHMPGKLDQGVLAQSFVLMGLWLGILTIKWPAKRAPALALGIVLGMAPAFHATLFILQWPLVFFFGLQWLLNRPVPRNIVYTVVALPLTSLLMLLPSAPFLAGQFSLYVFSWFHLYMAFLSSLLLLFFTFYNQSLKRCLGLLSLILFSLWCVRTEWREAFDYLLQYHSLMRETQPMQTALFYWEHYGLLLFAAPILWFAFVQSIRTTGHYYLWYSAIYLGLGACLLFFYYQWSYFGSLVLFIPLLYLMEKWLLRVPQARRFVVMGGLIALCYYPAVQVLQTTPIEQVTQLGPGGNLAYQYLYPIFGRVAEQCAREPGIILADPAWGPYLRYHTHCAVMANQLLKSPEQLAKEARVQALLSGSLQDFLRAKPPAQYVLVTPRMSWQSKWSERAHQPIWQVLPGLSNQTEPQLLVSSLGERGSLHNLLLYGEQVAWEPYFEVLYVEPLNIQGLTHLPAARFFRVR